MNKQAPFPNLYNVKLVAETSCKSCVICHRNTSTVLLSENRVDFFYVCASHLKDANFSTPLESTDYSGLVEQKKLTEQRIAEIKKSIDDIHPYKWNSIVSSIGFGKKEESDDKKKDSEDKRDSPKPQSSEDKRKLLQSELRNLSNTLQELSDKIVGYKFKSYKLDKDIYKIRLQNYLKVKYSQKREKEINSSGFFPVVPNNKIGESDS